MRVAAFLLLFITAPLIPPILLVLFTALYALLWTGYELLAIGFLIDAFYGSSAVWPLYTIGAGSVLLFIEWLKPYLSFYTTSDA